MDPLSEYKIDKTEIWDEYLLEKKSDLTNKLIIFHDLNIPKVWLGLTFWTIFYQIFNKYFSGLILNNTIYISKYFKDELNIAYWSASFHIFNIIFCIKQFYYPLEETTFWQKLFLTQDSLDKYYTQNYFNYFNFSRCFFIHKLLYISLVKDWNTQLFYYLIQQTTFLLIYSYIYQEREILLAFMAMIGFSVNEFTHEYTKILAIWKIKHKWQLFYIHCTSWILIYMFIYPYVIIGNLLTINDKISKLLIILLFLIHFIIQSLNSPIAKYTTKKLTKKENLSLISILMVQPKHIETVKQIQQTAFEMSKSESKPESKTNSVAFMQSLKCLMKLKKKMRKIYQEKENLRLQYENQMNLYSESNAALSSICCSENNPIN